MLMKKKFWTSPFRRPGNQDPSQVKIGHSGSRLSSVYLSDDSSANGFVIVPEFDEPVGTTQTDPEECNFGSTNAPGRPAATSSSCNRGTYSSELSPMSSRNSPYLHGHNATAGVASSSQDDDLDQRLGSAYEHIRAMSSPVSPRAVLSSDPQMLRKQLGVPQHSVLNYPIGSSLDLPNPYASPPSSPKLAPASSPSSTTPALTGEIPAESFPSQHDALIDIPTFHTDPHPLSGGLPRFAKRRGESHPPASSLFSSGWRPLNIPKKAAANSKPPINEHKRQISLPQIRSPSPFSVDIPLHHSWHERRTNFGFSVGSYADAATLKPRKRRTSGSTEVLASLAWIGTPPTMCANIGTSKLREGNSLPDCTQLSAAITVDDENISDDALVDRLERIRRIDSQSEQGEDHSPSRSSVEPCCPCVGGQEFECAPASQSLPLHQLAHAESNNNTPFPVKLEDTSPESEDAIVWESARNALLCIREIVRTEKKYQEALRMLLNAETATPPPPSMSPYVSALVRTSEMLLRGFLEDPSAWGVSTAFVTCEDELEATLVSWCAVAGTFFTEGSDAQPGRFSGRWRLRKPAVPSESQDVTPMPSSSSTTLKLSAASLSPKLPPILTPINIPSSKFQERTEEERRPTPRPQTDPDMQAEGPVPSQKREVTKGQAMTGQRPSRKLSVRELAIQPIQRIMRYVLLYRDLLHCTPSTSPSRLLVERALEAAVRIASRCDRAQSNPAFCLAS